MTTKYSDLSPGTIVQSMKIGVKEEFEGIVTEAVGTGVNIRDSEGNLWFRTPFDLTVIKVVTRKPTPLES